jgi:rhodanese-related sulfurtransferase
MSVFSRIFRKSEPQPEVWAEPRDLSAQLGTAALPLILDVRGPDEFSGPLGHIAGARNLPLDTLAAQLPELVRQGNAIVTVCKTDRRSATAARLLRDAGAGTVSVLRGGMEAWNTLGLPTA